MGRRLKDKPSGIVLVTVLLVIVVMIIFTIGLLSRSVTQTVSSEKQIDRIRAEQFAKGIFWQVYMNEANGGTVPNGTIFTSPTLDGKTFNATVVRGAAGSGTYGTTQFNIQVTY